MLSTSSLASLESVRHGFFTRQGGVSSGVFATRNCTTAAGDKAHRVAENRARACRELGLNPLQLITAIQVHGNRAIVTNKTWIKEAPKADALVTAAPGLALGLLTADCAPVLLADSTANVVAAAHAGWRGALAGVTDATLHAMSGLGADPARTVAAIGPCITQESYEVGAEFRIRFLEQDSGNDRFFSAPDSYGKRHFDLPGYLTMRLAAKGVGAIEAVKANTCSDESRFFSYRRSIRSGQDGGGRQISIISLSPG